MNVPAIGAPFWHRETRGGRGATADLVIFYQCDFYPHAESKYQGCTYAAARIVPDGDGRNGQRKFRVYVGDKLVDERPSLAGAKAAGIGCACYEVHLIAQALARLSTP
jgi:hypothetical protein